MSDYPLREYRRELEEENARLRKFSETKGKLIEAGQRRILELQTENARLREALEKIAQHKDGNDYCAGACKTARDALGVK